MMERKTKGLRLNYTYDLSSNFFIAVQVKQQKTHMYRQVIAPK